MIKMAQFKIELAIDGTHGFKEFIFFLHSMIPTYAYIAEKGPGYMIICAGVRTVEGKRSRPKQQWIRFKITYSEYDLLRTYLMKNEYVMVLGSEDEIMEYGKTLDEDEPALLLIQTEEINN